jgi:hypothetical protein
MPEVKILPLLMKQMVLARNDPAIIGLFQHLRFDLVPGAGIAQQARIRDTRHSRTDPPVAHPFESSSGNGESRITHAHDVRR